MRKRRLKKGTAIMLSAAMILTGITVPDNAGAAKKMSLNKKKVTIRVGKSVRLKLKNAKKKVKWKSANKKIATVSAKGVVRGKKAGKTKITAKCKGKKFICKVTVKKKKAASKPVQTVDVTQTPVIAATGMPASTVKPAGTSSPKPTAATGSFTAKPMATATQKPDSQVSAKPSETVGTPKPAASADPAATSIAGSTPEPAKTSSPAKTQDPQQSELPDHTQEPQETILPETSKQPENTSGPGQTKEPATDPSEDDDSYESVDVRPSKAAADTLAIGNLEVTLGMTKSQVQKMLGDQPVLTGTSPQGNEAEMYNPSDNYLNLIEVQYRNDSVVEMSTISKYFCYEDLVQAEDDTDKLLSAGFSSNSKYNYTIYTRTGDKEYINVMTDRQRDGKVYGIQIFDTSLGNLDSLLYPKNCTYDGINEFLGKESSEYLNAYRVYHLGEGEEMYISEEGAAQAQSEYMVKVNKNTSENEEWSSVQERFEDLYDNYGIGLTCGNEYASFGSVDAFSAVTYAIAESKEGTAFYQFILMQEVTATDQDTGEEVTYYVGEDFELYLECGFAAGNIAANRTFSAFDFYGM